MTQSSGPPKLRLAIGTWFFKLLVGSAPGGLPADFFTHAASTLLIFDEVICDLEAYESEMDFASGRRGKTQWLSSTLYRELKHAGILKPVSYREEAGEIIARFQAQGADERVSEIMQRERAKLRANPRAAQRRLLSPELRQLNAAFLVEFARLGFMPYDWKEGHLRPATVNKLLATSGNTVHSEEYELQKAASLILPRVTVLPNPRWVASIDEAAFRGYKDNVARERLPLYLWMYDDPEWTREKYNTWRLGPEFRAADMAFDRSREKHARKTLEAVLDVRERTRNERAVVQDLLRRSIQRQLRPAELRRELDEHLKRYQDLRGEESVALNLVIASGGLVSSFVSAALQNIGLSVVGAGIAAGIGLVSGGISGTSMVTAARDAKRKRQARRDEPVGWFVSEVRRKLG